MVRSARPLRAQDVQAYRVCDSLSGFVICMMVIFSPWAFGTTQPWSIWSMNTGGYVLGLLLAAKLVIRRFKDYRPPRWGETRRDSGRAEAKSPAKWLNPERLTLILAALTLAIVGFCFVSAINARATYEPAALSFFYHACMDWLPHSLDSHKTWGAFSNYLAIAVSFWAVRDWLLGKSGAEERAERHGGQEAEGEILKQAGPPFPARLRLLLWLLAVNGALLGLESIAQRIEGSGKLLFLVKPRVNPGAESQFGPYAYRSNAAQYFNLLWPVCVGFWWMLQRSGSSRGATHHLLLVCSVVMAACPIISISRGGALVTVGILVLAVFFMVATHFLFPTGRDERSSARTATLWVILLFFVASLVLGFSLGWKALKPRMAGLSEGFEGREEMYAAARPMARDYPIFGVGPGAFETVFENYRISTETYWPAQLHNDWLETRITFGLVGSALILCAFFAVVLRWFAPGGLHGGRRFVILIWLGLAGCLAHARFDFPFQIYSILFLFVVLCAVLFNLTRRPRG